jgi:hypothetical protein
LRRLHAHIRTWLTRVKNKPNKNQWAKGSTQGLKCYNVSLVNGSEGPNQTLEARGIYPNNLGSFLLLDPGFFFGASGPAQKAYFTVMGHACAIQAHYTQGPWSNGQNLQILFTAFASEGNYRKSRRALF